MNVLVIGATGFIGRRLIDVLATGGHVPYALSRSPDAALACETRVAAAGIESIRTAIDGWRIDAVVNLAAAGVHPGDRDTGRLIATNALLPAELVELAAGKAARAFLQIGSSAEYARSTESVPLAETAALERGALYGASKAAGSLLAQASGKSHGVPVAVLRPFNIFGAGEKPHRLLPSLVTKLLNGEKVPLSPGLQARDFLHVDDACGAIVRFLEALSADAGLAGEYNLASGEACTVAAFSKAVAEALGADGALLDFGALPMRPDDLPYVVAATAKLDNVIGPSSRHSLPVALGLCVREMTGGE